MSVNRVILIGRLGKDPEIKYAASGTAICRFSLATNETFKNKAGDKEQRTEWHSCVCFGKTAEIAGQYLSKGRLVFVDGSIRTGNWKGRDGNERKSYDIVARYTQMLSPAANDSGSRPKDTNPSQVFDPPEEDNPFREDGANEALPF